VSHLNSQAPGRQLTRNQIGAVVALALILALGMCLRFQELRSVPGWASDEGSNIDIANRLAQGRLGYLAIGRSSFINGHPHFFYLILAGLYRLADFDLVWARGLTAVYGMVTMVLLYLVTDRMFNRATALLAALIFAVYPRAVLYNRMAFTYNQLQPLYVMALYLLWRYLESGGRRWLVYASLCVGAALVTDLTATSLLLVLLLLVLVRRPKHVLWAVPLSLSLPAAWGVALWSLGGHAFIDDLAFTLSRAGGNPLEQIVRVVLLYPAALEGDVWLFAGAVGLFLVRERRPRVLALALFFGSLLLTVRAGAASGIASYLLIPLFPLAALGVAHLIVRAVPHLLREFESDLGAGLSWQAPWSRQPEGWRVLRMLVVGVAVFLIVLTPLVAAIAEGLFLDYATAAAHLAGTLADPAEAERVAHWVNVASGPDSVVLASPNVLWLLEAQGADFQQAVAIKGLETQHYPAGVSRDRFSFDCSLENADYVIIDPLWRGWASRMMPEVARMVAEVETWPLATTAGDFEVYRNPAKRP
jgi:4-amino-4-deoxy-L-arabinose transferase-like glycosyltransferase